MTFAPIPFGSSPDAGLLAEAEATMADVRSRLAHLVPRVASAAERTRWSSPSARAFGESVEQASVLLRAAWDRSDVVVDGLARARVASEALAGGLP